MKNVVLLDYLDGPVIKHVQVAVGCVTGSNEEKCSTDVLLI